MHPSSDEEGGALGAGVVLNRKCRNSRHGLPARESVTARMAVPHFGCGSAALCNLGNLRI